MRVVKKVPVTFYSCNAGRITNKMAILAHDVQKHKLDMIHISEAGLQKKEPMGLTGYKSVKLERSEQNRGSLMYIKNDLNARMVRVYTPKEEKTGAEVIQMQMDTVPPTNIFGVYLETGKFGRGKGICIQQLTKKSDRMQKGRTECHTDGRFQCPPQRHSQTI